MVVSVVIVIVTTLIFSAFFSGMEIAFVSANKLKLEIDRKQSRTFDRIANVFLRDPGQYITTILVGNNIALVIYSLYMSMLIRTIGGSYGFNMGEGSVVLETVISTIIIIFAGEFIPKATFKNNPNFFFRALSPLLYLIYIILYPVAKFFTWLSKQLLKLMGVKVKAEHEFRGFDRIDLTLLLEENKDSVTDSESENEIKLFRNALDFSDLLVRHCMVPRVEIEAVDINDTIEEISARFVSTNFSRIFVYEESIDNIIGYVSTKSLFTAPKTIKEVLRPVDYVPESMSAHRLLSMFTKNTSAVAIVIDELGGTAGMVSMEDVLEEIFGEIEDEHDSQDMVEKVVVDGVEYVFSCRLEVDYLNEKYAFNIPESDEYDTLAGYIIFYHKGIPSQGEVLMVDGKEIKILRMSGSKLDLARVKILKDKD